MACLIGFLRVWHPKELWLSPKLRSRDDSAASMPPAPPAAATVKPTNGEVWVALLPWIIVCAILLLWGTDWFKAQVNPWAIWAYPVGNLQKITSEQLGLSPILMGAANSSGGVMGKMIDAQSIVVASTATNWFGHEGTILRFVFGHSIALACLVGLLVMLQAYVLTGMIVH